MTSGGRRKPGETGRDPEGKVWNDTKGQGVYLESEVKGSQFPNGEVRVQESRVILQESKSGRAV